MGFSQGYCVSVEESWTKIAAAMSSTCTCPCEPYGALQQSLELQAQAWASLLGGDPDIPDPPSAAGPPGLAGEDAEVFVSIWALGLPLCF